MSFQEAQDLFNRLIANETRADLVILFRRNPGLIDTLEGIARRIGSHSDSIKDDMSELVKIGVIYQRKLGGRAIFGYDASKDRQVQDSVGSYMKGIKERRD